MTWQGGKRPGEAPPRSRFARLAPLVGQKDRGDIEASLHGLATALKMRKPKGASICGWSAAPKRKPSITGKSPALYPLSAYGKDYTPPAGKVDPSIDMKTAVREQVNKMDAVEYFTLLCELHEGQSAAPRPTRRSLETMARIGIVPGPGFRQEQVRSRLRQARAARSPSTASCCTSSSATATSRISTAGGSRPRPASTARTTSSARSSRPSALAPTGRRTRSTRPRRNRRAA